MAKSKFQSLNPADKLNGRMMDVRRDSADFRDRIYLPVLETLPREYLPDPSRILLRNQGEEGACTGFGLAAMINFLHRGKGIDEPVSERMLYEMAKQHDRWPGEAYAGSSARGAMKGWNKNGVCSNVVWPYKANTYAKDYLTSKRAEAALKYPLGAYYRVLKKRSDMHSAVVETGAVFVSATVHDGWTNPTKGIIEDSSKVLPNGGHAFCVIGYTDEGFIIQNSWGGNWGGVDINGENYPGCAIWKYGDFDVNFWDGWVAQMALPVESLEALQGGSIIAGPQGTKRVQKGPPQHKIADHYIHIDDGQFDPKGDYPSFDPRVRDLIHQAVKDMAGSASEAPGHILLYAHGGLNSIKGSATRAEKWMPVMENNRIRQIHFLWESGFYASLKDVLLGKDDFSRNRAGGFSDWTDTLLERVTQPLGYPLWMEMTEDTQLAFKTVSAAGSRTLTHLKAALMSVPAARRPKLHLAGHSAGSLWIGRLLNRWYKMDGVPIETLQLFAPACPMGFYRKNIKVHLGQSKVRALIHYHLDKERELDDNVARIYRKSLLYLVSHSYQSKSGTIPIMGMEKYWGSESHSRITTYDTASHSAITSSDSHGGFDNDKSTMNHLLAEILGANPSHTFNKQHLKGY